MLFKQDLAQIENVVLMFTDGEERFIIFGFSLITESFSVRSLI